MADSDPDKQPAPAFDNPLMPSARLRQIYQVMVWARMVGKSLPASKRGRGVSTAEACLVSPTVDLAAGDLIGDTLSGGVIDFLRGASLADVLLGPGKSRKGTGFVAGCGAAGRLPAVKDFEQRMWAAIGAASTFKALPGTTSLGVAVVYVTAADARGPAWSRVLKYAAETVLPLIFVVLPKRAAASAESGTVSAASLRCGVPGIAVDADDAVAIYRVAQESIVRARSGGGAAVIECVPFILAGPGGKPETSDAVVALEKYMLPRGVVTQRWLDRESAAFAKRLAVLQVRAAVGAL